MLNAQWKSLLATALVMLVAPAAAQEANRQHRFAHGDGVLHEVSGGDFGKFVISH